MDGSTGNYGIKQPIANAKAGAYILAWKQSGRNSAKAEADSYLVKVYYMNGTTEVPIGQSAQFTNLNKLAWTDNTFGFKITTGQFAAAGSNPIYVAFLPTGNLNTYGTLIDKVNLISLDLMDIKNHDSNGDDVIISNWRTTQQISGNNIAWIEAHSSANNAAPRMPQLELRSVGLGQGLTIQAKIEVQYDRGNGARSPARNQPEDLVRIPDNGNYQAVTGDTWIIWESYANQPFFGGEATLTYRLMNGQNQIMAPETVRFRIGGKNPDAARARLYIESLDDAGTDDPLWFAYAIAKSESKDYNGTGTRYNQFWQLPRDENDTAYRATRNTHAGRPIWGNDGGTTPGGYGMYQVTGNSDDSTVNIARQEIWNWQENARAGLAILESKRTIADTWMTRQKNADNSNGVALPNLTVQAVTFAEDTNRTMNHAVAIKAWNGASAAPAAFTDPEGAAVGFIIDPQGSGHFCYWKNSAPGSNKWALSRYNNPPVSIQPFNYVDRVCQEIE